MINSGNRNNWKLIAIGASILTSLLVLFVLWHDLQYIDSQCEQEIKNSRSTTNLSEQARSLSNAFALQGWVFSQGCAEQAKEFFYNQLPSNDKKKLFSAQLEPSEWTTLVQGLYSALPNAVEQRSEQASQLLRQMEEALAQEGSPL